MLASQRPALSHPALGMRSFTGGGGSIEDVLRMIEPSYICRHMHNVRNWRSELERMTDDGFKDVSYAGPPPYSRRQALNFGIITIACEILFLLTGDIKKSMPLLIDKIMDFKEALLSHNPWTRVPKNAIAIKKLSILVTHRPHIFSCRIRGIRALIGPRERWKFQQAN